MLLLHFSHSRLTIFLGNIINVMNGLTYNQKFKIIAIKYQENQYNDYA